jgi:hypothetical protein
MTRHILPASIMIANIAKGQTDSSCTRATAGCAVDALPCITGGYCGWLWIGHDHMLYRAIVTRVTTPDVVSQDGFTNNTIMACTAIAGDFITPHFEQWLIGAGLEYWERDIHADATLSTQNATTSSSLSAGGTCGSSLTGSTSIHGRRDI